MSARIPQGIEATPPIIAMFETFGPSYVWFAVTTSMLASFATLLPATIINVAIPEVMGSFGLGQDQAQWLATGFLAAGTSTPGCNSGSFNFPGSPGAPSDYRCLSRSNFLGTLDFCGPDNRTRISHGRWRSEGEG